MNEEPPPEPWGKRIACVVLAWILFGVLAYLAIFTAKPLAIGMGVLAAALLIVAVNAEYALVKIRRMLEAPQ